MEIKEDSFLTNRTREFVLPLIKSYGKELIDYLNNVFKLAVGIGDHVIPNVKNALFFLIDTEKNKRVFIDFLEWIKTQQYYIMDYPFDDIVEGYQHMVVISIPEKVYNNFATSTFSNMYTGEQIKSLFDKSRKQFTILTRDRKTLEAFVDGINKEYDTNYSYDEWDGEIMFPIKPEEEKF